MKDGINSKGMKFSNALLVLDTVMKNAPISRSDLVRKVGLTQVSVINITNELLDAGIVQEAGKAGGSSQGRRSLVLDVREDAFYGIGFELSVGKLAAGLCNAKGELIDFIDTDFPAESAPECLADRIEEIVNGFLETYKLDRERVLGVGIALPGPLDVQRGMVFDPPNFPAWKDVPVRKMVEKRLGMRVCMDKETNLAALAESFYGVSAGYQTSFFMSLFRLGIGGGLVSKGNIFHGFRDGAGEVGHMLVDSSGPRCGCGNYGCLEAMIAEKYVLEQVRHWYKTGMAALQPEDIDALTLEEVFRRSEKGDPVCGMAVRQMAGYLSVAVGNIINMFSPELVVLGGTLPEMCGELTGLVEERVRSRRYPAHCRDVKIVSSSLGSKAYVRGALALAMKTFLPEMLAEAFLETKDQGGGRET